MPGTKRRDQMRRLLERREREGLTYAELEARTGVSRHTLAWWAWRLRQERERAPANGPGDFLEISVLPDEETSDAGIELELANGRRLVLRSGFDEETLRRAVAVLEQTC